MLPACQTTGGPERCSSGEDRGPALASSGYSQGDRCIKRIVIEVPWSLLRVYYVPARYMILTRR